MLFFLGTILLYVVNWADIALFRFYLHDQIDALASSEDWTRAPALPDTLDYSWAKNDGTGVLRIAHALGGRYTPLENSFKALDLSLQNAIKIVEFDLFRTKDGNIYCAHDENAVVLAKDSGCSVPALMARLQKDKFNLILDNKSDFEKEGSAFLKQLPDPSLARHIIFEIYTPQDVATFKNWLSTYDLPGPIVAAYRSNRHARHIMPALVALNIHAVAVLTEKMQEYSFYAGKTIQLLPHPIKDCAEYAAVQALGASGAYVPSAFSCPAAH